MSSGLSLSRAGMNVRDLGVTRSPLWVNGSPVLNHVSSPSRYVYQRSSPGGGGVVVVAVEPGGPLLDHPAALRSRRRVARGDDAAALARVGGPVPADDEAVLRAGEVGQLVEGEQVVRPPLVLDLVVLRLAA